MNKITWSSSQTNELSEPTWDLQNMQQPKMRTMKITSGDPLKAKPFPVLPQGPSPEVTWASGFSTGIYRIERFASGTSFNTACKFVEKQLVPVTPEAKHGVFEWDSESNTLIYYPIEEEAKAIQVCNFTVDFVSKVLVHSSASDTNIKYLCRIRLVLPAGRKYEKEFLTENVNFDEKFLKSVEPLIYIEPSSRNLFNKYIHSVFYQNYNQLTIEHRYEFNGWYFDREKKIWKFLSANQKDVSGCWKLQYNTTAACEFLPTYFSGIAVNKGIILLFYVLYSLIRELFIAVGIKSLLRSVLALVAETNVGKTTLVTALTAPIWIGTSREVCISFNSTKPYIENELTSCNGFWAIVDDYRPTLRKTDQLEQNEKFEILCRCAGDATMPGKCIAAGQSGKQHVLKAGVITTHEFLPFFNASSLLRLLPLELNRSEINIRNLGFLHNNPEIVASFFGCFVKYIESNQESILQTLPDMQDRSIQIIENWIKEDFEGKTVEPRRISDLATLLTVGEIFINYIGTNPNNTKYVIHNNLRSFMKHLLGNYAPVDIVEVVKQKLKEAIADGTLEIADTGDEFKVHSYDGYRDGNTIYIVKRDFDKWIQTIKAGGLDGEEIVHILSAKKFLTHSKNIRYTTGRKTKSESFYTLPKSRKNGVVEKKERELRPYLYKIYSLEDI